jgi:hypothetical protein
MVRLDPHNAQLLLQIYDLRREERLRAARAWLLPEFAAGSMKEFMELYPPGTDHNAYFRQVLTYWDMVAAIVNRGMIDEDLRWRRNRKNGWPRARPRPWRRLARCWPGSRRPPRRRNEGRRSSTFPFEEAQFDELAKSLEAGGGQLAESFGTQGGGAPRSGAGLLAGALAERQGTLGLADAGCRRGGSNQEGRIAAA